MTVAVSLGAGFVPPAWLQAVMRLIAKPASKRTAVGWSILLGDDDFFMVQKYMRLLAGKLSVLRREPDFCQVYGSVADDWLSEPCGTFRLITSFMQPQHGNWAIKRDLPGAAFMEFEQPMFLGQHQQPVRSVMFEVIGYPFPDTATPDDIQGRPHHLEFLFQKLIFMEHFAKAFAIRDDMDNLELRAERHAQFFQKGEQRLQPGIDIFVVAGDGHLGRAIKYGLGGDDEYRIGQLLHRVDGVVGAVSRVRGRPGG